ncbi:HAD family hydrolase [Rhodococcoides trifolii]|nr:HAD family hydrolase [Rhodococcus trifolii]
MIYSAGAMREGRRPAGMLREGRKDVDVECVEYLDGEPLSFMTAEAARLLRALAAETVVVPTTTRTIEQFRRIDLPGGPWRYAITSNGGNILVDGEPDAAWRERVDADAASTGAPLPEVLAEMHSRCDPSWVLKERTADDLFCYLVVQLDAMPATFVPEWSEWCAERGWGVSQQGRKVYSMPEAVCKSKAVAEVKRRLVADGVIRSNELVVAAGDGALDAEMLLAADRAARPRHGELESLGWQRDGLFVTHSSGGAAAEELLRWMAEHVDRAVPATHASYLPVDRTV